MQQALAWFEDVDGNTDEGVQAPELISALKEALEQTEQEPVAWMFQHEETGRTMCVDAQQVEWGFENANPRLKKIGPLYTSPPQRQPLTDEEVDEIVDAHTTDDGQGYDIWCDGRGVARAIEAKLKEKNT